MKEGGANVVALRSGGSWGCPVCPIKELISCPNGCVENTLTHFLFLLIEILA